MKKIKLLFLLLLIIILSSCKNNEKKTVNPQEKILNYKLKGKNDIWEIDNVNYCVSDTFKIGGGTLFYISEDKIKKNMDFISIEILKVNTNTNIEETLLYKSVKGIPFQKEIKLGTISSEASVDDNLDNDNKLYCIITYKNAENKIKKDKIPLSVELQ